jgi:hypothetical protein
MAWTAVTNAPTLLSDVGGIKTYRIVDNIPLDPTSRRFMRISLSPEGVK